MRSAVLVSDLYQQPHKVIRHILSYAEETVQVNLVN